ncbi:MAG: sensor histidine kinase, partial [Nocardioidaceae bacterium]
MRHSVLVRSLALSLLVALGAVIATAVLATYSTSEQLQGEVDASASQLISDGEIYTELLNYAGDHATWSGVGEVVQSLANRTGRRIALTTADGSVIADSARSLGAGPELPSRPAATLDVMSQNAMFGASTTVAGGKTASGRIAAAKPVMIPAMVGSPYWRMTEEEKRQRTKLAQQAVACLRASGQDAVITEGEAGVPQVAVQETLLDDGNSIVYVNSKGLLDDPCVPAGLYAASAVALAVNADQVERSISCLTAAGERFSMGKEQGLRYIVPSEPATASTPVAPPSATFQRCTERARAAALSPYVASPARLYLGSGDNFNVFSGEGMLRTAATALGVLLVATVVTVLAGRRLVRPI